RAGALLRRVLLLPETRVTRCGHSGLARASDACNDFVCAARITHCTHFACSYSRFSILDVRDRRLRLAAKRDGAERGRGESRLAKMFMFSTIASIGCNRPLVNRIDTMIRDRYPAGEWPDGRPGVPVTPALAAAGCLRRRSARGRGRHGVVAEQDA